MPREHILENKIHTHIFLTAVLEGDECLILRRGSFTPIKELPASVEKRGRVGLRAVWKLWKQKSLDPAGIETPYCPTHGH